MPVVTVCAWDAAYLQAVLAPYQRFGGDSGLVHALARERRAVGLEGGGKHLARVERGALAWAAAAWWRMAPWRHGDRDWSDWVERVVDAAS